MSISVAARQRIVSGLWGGRLAGSFAGRTAVAAAITTATGVHRHRFLRRGPKLPWERDKQETPDEQVVVAKSIRRRVKLPAAVREALDGDIPIQTSVVLDAPSIKLPGVGTARLHIAQDDEEEAVIMAILQ